MLRLVQASIRLIGDVNTCIDIVIHNTAHEGYEPFGSIKAHYGNGRTLRHVQLVACLGKSERILVV